MGETSKFMKGDTPHRLRGSTQAVVCAMQADAACLSHALSVRAKSGDHFLPQHSGLVHAALQLVEDTLTTAAALHLQQKVVMPNLTPAGEVL